MKAKGCGITMRINRAYHAGGSSSCPVASPERIRVLQDDLAAIDRSLGLLDPSMEPRKIKVLKPTHRFKYFEAGELAKLIFDQLRKAEGKPV